MASKFLNRISSTDRTYLKEYIGLTPKTEKNRWALPFGLFYIAAFLWLVTASIYTTTPLDYATMARSVFLSVLFTGVFIVSLFNAPHENLERTLRKFYVPKAPSPS